MIATLGASLVEAVLAGDIEAARVAHEAIGRQLREHAGDGAAVVDLAAWRAPKK